MDDELFAGHAPADLPAYLAKFSVDVDDYRERAVAACGISPATITAGMQMYPPKMAANAAFVGFEMGLPAVVAAALFVQAVALSVAGGSAGWKTLVSRRHRATRDVHAWAYSTADFILQPVGREQTRELRANFLNMMVAYAHGTCATPRTKAILQQMECEAQADDDIEF